MGLNDTPMGERIHISFFGLRNAGKSSLINAIAGQDVSIVSDVPGTTTDPVTKTMELLPLGPVVLIDTPGIDDEGALGEKRIDRTKNVLAKTDIAVLVIDAKKGISRYDREMMAIFAKRGIPYLIARNKVDIYEDDNSKDQYLDVSAKTGLNISKFKDKLSSLKVKGAEKPLVKDLFNKGDTIILVTPIDESAPKGRLILPQQQVIREIIENGGIAIVCQVDMLKNAVKETDAKLVITDSQVFKEVDEILPSDMPLTSFSILFARYKGEIELFEEGIRALDRISDGDRILICEGCTHHRQCNDIGTVKIPSWISDFSGEKPEFEFTSGGDFPEDLKGYSMIIHCGGCMLNHKEMKRRLEAAKEQNIPIVNYGMLIAKINGILDRALKVL